MNTHSLKTRTNLRNDTIWNDINPIAYMGIINPLFSEESLFDDTNKRLVDTVVSVVDDEVRIKEEQLNDSSELETAKIANEQAIADSKAVNERAIITLQTTTNAYLILVDKYIKDVQALLMSAKEHALTIQEQEIALGLLRAEVAEEKADARIAELDMRIDLEEINRKFVEVEVLKAELDVAKANVRLVMTQIEIDEAELKVIQARVDKALMAVEKVTLEADVALIFADIATRKLTETKYNVESAEITATYTWIADRLQSVLDILTVRQSQIEEQIKLQNSLLSDETVLYNAKIDNTDIQYEETQSNEDVQNYEESAITSTLASEKVLKNDILTIDLAYEATKSRSHGAKESATASTSFTTSDNHTQTYAYTHRLETAQVQIIRAISRG